MRQELTVLPEGHVVVALSGEIDLVTAPEVRIVLAEASSKAVTKVTVDLSKVTFLDAAGLGVLVGASRRAQHLPGGLRLVAVPARVSRLLRLTGLDHLAVSTAPSGSPGQREPAAPVKETKAAASSTAAPT